jgi:hypothetical protein
MLVQDFWLQPCCCSVRRSSGMLHCLIGSLLLAFRDKFFVLFQASRSQRFFLECFNLEDGTNNVVRKRHLEIANLHSATSREKGTL